MSDWDVAMRYAPGRDIPSRNVQRWKEHARSLLKAMEAG
jgi:hypothetical protein